MDFDYDLTPDQWETLKALRKSAISPRTPTGLIVGQLIDLGLAAVIDGIPVITSTGRKVLIRGSSRLLDVAA
jgi:hypothetical protein